MNDNMCQDCKYFYNQYQDGGQCRRNSPKPVCGVAESHNIDLEVYWPNVNSDDWCGDFVRSIKKE